MQLVETENGLHVDWQMLPERPRLAGNAGRAYLLRTNLRAESAAELWTKYMQLTEAEAAFRALKSALSIRPLFHQLEPRVKAHIWWLSPATRSIARRRAPPRQAYYYRCLGPMLIVT